MPSPSPHMSHIRWVGTYSKGRQGRIITWHSTLFSTHFHHAQSSFLPSSSDIPLSFNALLHYPTIPFMAFLSTFYSSHQIPLYSSTNHSSSILSFLSKPLKHFSAQPTNSLVTPVILRTSSFLTGYTRVVMGMRSGCELSNGE